MKRILITCGIIASMMGCGVENDSHDGHLHGEKGNQESEHIKPEINIVSFTPVQLSTAGIGEGLLEMKNLRTSIRAYGTLSVPNQNKALITTLSTGVLKALYIQPGSYVRKGQVVASILNPETVPMQLEYQTMLGQVELCELEFKRQTELVAGNAAPLKNLQRVRTELATLKAACRSFEKQLTAFGISQAGVAKGKIITTINLIAPISGTVSKVTAQIGSAIDQNSSVAEIVNNAELHLDLFVYEKDLARLQKHQTVHFTLSNNPDKEYDAIIFSIGTAFVNESTTIPVHAVVIGKQRELIEGMNVTALISVGQKRTVAVPTASIVAEQGKHYIFVKTDAPENTDEPGAGKNHGAGKRKSGNQPTYFERVMVVKGVSDVGYTEITVVKSIPPNASIITRGAFFALAKMSDGGDHAH